ncbi:MAG TPA: TonB-dependent receptor plug domain-containing protein, partial [Ignavibacteriaceae bacterium]|nr:TonB-dependent receptor plug domain-containing protein [Ignavibacteriaceae bacterium]
NTTNQTSIVNQEDIKNLPIRGVNSIVGTQAGIVTQGGNIYVRGSRSDGVAFYVDGVLVTNPVTGGSTTGMINNAIEEIQVQAGGYSAEFGGANGGIISTTTRSGSENYNFGFEGITDNFANAGEEFLGGYAYGYSEYTFTAGGPVLPSYKDLKFFIAGNNIYQRSPAGYYREYNFQNIVDPDAPSKNPETGLDDTINVFYPNGTVLNNGNNTYQIQGNLNWNINPFSIKINVNHRWTESRDGFGWTEINRINSAGLRQNYTFTGSAKITHVISPVAFYDVIFNYFNNFAVQMDPVFQHNITAYGDSIENAKFGRTLRRDGETATDLQAYSFGFERYDRPFNGYTKSRYESFGGKLNFLYQLGKVHEIKTGGEYNYYTIRNYNIGPLTIADNIKAIADGAIRQVYNRLDNYGYDVYGNELNDGLEGPKHPVFSAFYIQDKMEFTDLVLNIGFRLDYINTDSKTFKDPHNIQFNSEGVFDSSSLVDLDPILQVSPRLGFSFPVTDQTVFHAQYGKFIQQSQLRNLYLGINRSSDIIKGGFAELNPVGYGLKPERTTQYEIGFKQQLGSNFAFDITGFYKDIKDQIQIRTISSAVGASHAAYYALVNGDFSTVKGVELKLDLRRTNRFSASVDYTYSDAQGTGSTPNEAGRVIWQSPTSTPFFPLQIAPLTFNQTHRGSINLDFRFADSDGPEVMGSQILSNFGLNLLFSFNSGFNYTRFEGFGNARTPLEALNSSVTPWNFQLDAKIDKSFSLGPLDLNIYLWVINLLDIKNVIGVFGTSGDPIDDGWLASPEGSAVYQNYLVTHGQEAADTYKALYLASIYNSGNFGTPRQIRLGLRLDY